MMFEIDDLELAERCDKLRDLAESVNCPDCCAVAGYTCTRDNAYSYYPHFARIVLALSIPPEE